MSLSARRSDLIVYLSPAHTATHVHTQTHSPTCLSFHCEATGLLDRSQQLVIQLVVALVGRNVNPIEAGMGFGQIVGVSIDLMNGEESGSRSAL